MTKDDETIKRRQEAGRAFEKYPGKISLAIQEGILANRIAFGMTPYDCFLAAGAFTFAVSPDTAKWQANADPWSVMWAQSVEPDDSKIAMIFKTDTQYLGEGPTRFRVRFERGVAVSIEKLKGGER